MNGQKFTRRRFLRGGLLGAGLTLAVVSTPWGSRLVSAKELEKSKDQDFSPNVWLRVAPDNSVTVVVNKSEMGQGVYTALPMIVADELEADWDRVRFEPAPAGPEYIDPVWGTQLTGGSASIRHMTEPLRLAGAAAREMLITAAAQEWGIPASECRATAGTVRNERTGRSLLYGMLAARASHLPVPQAPRLKKPSEFRLMGKGLPRMDVADKAHGVAKFGIDTLIPGMLYASVARPPAYGAEAESMSREAALRLPEVEYVIPLKSGVAVCATTPWSAWKGRGALKIMWGKGEEPDLDTARLEKRFLDALGNEGVRVKMAGDADAALEGAHRRTEAVYLLPYLAHATMEPMNCTARVDADGCEVWVPTQNQSGVLGLAAKVSGLDPGKIKVHTTYLGGGFGRRFEMDVVEEALALAKETKKPVKVLWTREEDTGHDFYRPANASSIRAGVDEKGRVVAWHHRIACPSIWSRVMPDRMKNGIDPAAVEGVADTFYSFPNFRVDYIQVDTPVPVGFWRSVGHSSNGFIMEGFMDEMAHLARRDPLEFRMDHLGSAPRVRRLLEVVADKGGWGKPLPEGRFQGIAQHHSFGSLVAELAEVSVDKATGKVRVHRVVCAVDCGRVINPAILTAQVRGAVLFGLSAIMHEKVELRAGGIASSNFDNYHVLRLNEAPDIEVHIVDRGEKSGGIGEPGVPPIGPAVANAIFAAAGARLRRPPMTPEAVKAAIGSA